MLETRLKFFRKRGEKHSRRESEALCELIRREAKAPLHEKLCPCVTYAIVEWMYHDEETFSAPLCSYAFFLAVCSEATKRGSGFSLLLSSEVVYARCFFFSKRKTRSLTWNDDTEKEKRQRNKKKKKKELISRVIRASIDVREDFKENLIVI